MPIRIPALMAVLFLRLQRERLASPSRRIGRPGMNLAAPGKMVAPLMPFRTNIPPLRAAARAVQDLNHPPRR
ncbi:hypothetical protein [Neotabrizicola sp. VNH66]|uniref:hypothetical protein n=1 Tax=Neotabrizicola sp. VNH66 TaxID=3400918 RepID=UPI003BFD7ED6